MSVLAEKWHRFWFEPVEPTNLAACRILFYGAFFLYYLPYDFGDWGRLSPVFWMPIDLFKHTGVPAFSADAIQGLEWFWKLALLCSCVGLFTRLSTWTAFLLGAYLIGLTHSFGKVQHDDAIFAITLGVMTLSRCGDKLSLDDWWRKKRLGEPPAYRRSGEYRWPVRLVWLLFAFVFFGAGVSKLRHGGTAWLTSDSLAILLVRHAYHVSDADPLVSWGLYIARHPWLYKTLAAATLFAEIAYPLALFSRRARWMLVPLMFLIQVGIRVVMGPTFYPLMICNLFWVPWDRVFTKKPPRSPLDVEQEKVKPHATIQ